METTLNIDVELAIDKRNDQGNYECEVWTTETEGEAEWRDCLKYSGHTQFILPRELSINHLPEPFRDENVLEYVRYMCERTVKLLVNYTSQNRPDDCQFAKSRGKCIAHHGTGLIYSYEYPKKIGDEKKTDEIDEDNGVDECMEETSDANKDLVEETSNANTELECSSGDVEDESIDSFDIFQYFDCRQDPCPCRECVRSGKKCWEWGNVYVLTAKHVVFDKLEAEKTIVEMYYEDKQKNNVKKLYGVDVGSKDINKGDWIKLECVTHDRDLFAKLYSTSERFSDLKDTINEMYWESPSRMSLIVSHPHGWVKQVTIGDWTERHVIETSEDGDELVGYTYNTATCKGSSGAPVLILGMRDSNSDYRTWLARHHVHCSSKALDKNISGLEEEIKVELEDDTEVVDDEVVDDEVVSEKC